MINPILLTLFIFGAWISFYDLKAGKIKNYSLLILLSVAVLINIYFTRAFIEFPLVSLLNILSAIFIGVIVWLAGLWSAADAKLFIVLNFLFPATFYQHSIGYFPGVALLINSAMPLFFFLFFQVMFKTNLKEKKEALLHYLKLNFIFHLLLTVSAIFCLIFLVSQFLDIRLDYPVWLAFIFLLFWFIEQKLKINLRYFFLSVVILAVFLSFVFGLSLFNLGFLFFVLTLFCLFFLMFVILTLSTPLFTDAVEIDKLEEGMIPAEMVVKTGEKFAKKPITFLTFLVLLRQRAKWRPLIGFNPDGLEKEEIEELQSLRRNKLLTFERLRISKTIPFAIILFVGALITYFFKGLFSF